MKEQPQTFYTKVPLPEMVRSDDAKANLNNCILEITPSKKEPEETKKISNRVSRESISYPPFHVKVERSSVFPIMRGQIYKFIDLFFFQVSSSKVARGLKADLEEALWNFLLFLGKDL